MVELKKQTTVSLAKPAAPRPGIAPWIYTHLRAPGRTLDDLRFILFVRS